MLGSLGGPEIILIFIVALIVFGPKRLPEIGRKVGEILRDLRRATGDFRSSMEREIGFDPLNTVQQAQKARRDILSTVSDPIRDVAQGTLAAARDVRREAGELIGPAANPEPAADPVGAYPPDAARAREGQKSFDFGAGGGIPSEGSTAPPAGPPPAGPAGPPAATAPDRTAPGGPGGPAAAGPAAAPADQPAQPEPDQPPAAKDLAG
jgi:Tat protein translocase TatB subunit